MKAIAGLCKASALSLLLHALHSGSGPSALPDPRRTPGAVNPAVTQANIDSTICVQGWTRTVRPPERYTESLKRQQMREYGYTDHHLSDFEEDHLIPLELAGAPADPRNLWPEPHVAPGGWGSRRKDYLLLVAGFDFGCSVEYSVGRVDTRNPGARPFTVGKRIFG